MDKKISIKNYIYVILTLVGSIILTLYIFELINARNEEKLMNSYLISTKTITSSIDNIDLLDEIRQESPSSYFIYLGYKNNEDVYNLEKELKDIIDDYDLNNIFYYVDVTNLLEKDNYLDYIKNKIGIEKLENVPAIIYVKDGEILDTNILDGIKETKLKSTDLENLLIIYDYKKIK